MTICETPPEEFYNLTVILAYGVLDEVLGELISQGSIPNQSSSGRLPLLGTKMNWSRNSLNWINYEAAEEGKNERNAIAHDGALLPKSRCLQLVGLIESELRAWAIL